MAATEQVMVTHRDLNALNLAVNEMLGEGWQTNGQPFRDDRRDLWCQAVIRVPDAKAGQLPLREQKGKR